MPTKLPAGRRDTVSIYRDVGGGSLHRRGYRRGPIHRAALNEAAAAAMLRVAGWDELCLGMDRGYEATAPLLVDPMCGSGTLLTEAALMALQVAPGLLRWGYWGPGERRPGREHFRSWRDFNAKAYE